MAPTGDPPPPVVPSPDLPLPWRTVDIVIDYRPALRERTGVGEYVHRLVLALAEQTGQPDGPRVTVFSSSWRDRLDRAQLAGVAAIDRRVPVRVLNLLWHRLGWPPIERLAGARFDVAHAPHPLLMPTRGAAQVVTIHDLHFLDHPERTRAEIRRDYPPLAQAHAWRADRIVTPSRYTAREVERRFGVPSDRITVCPSGAPDWTPRANWPADGYILFVGTLEPRKNVGALLDAYARLLGRRPDAPDLVLAGRAAPDAAPWLRAAAEPPLAGRVRHIGYTAPDQRRALYAGAALLVLPSFDEGFGLPVLEAMTIGVPVVASDRGALPEVLGDAGLLVGPEDVEELARAMERMLFDRSLAERAVAAGLLRARTFTWRASADAHREAYARAIEARRRRGERAHGSAS